MGYYKALVLTGYPGSGKGTVAEMLTKYDEFHHLSTGDLFNGLEAKEDKSEWEVIAWECMFENKYVPDEITLKLFKFEIIRRVGQDEYNPKSQILILDGIPRTTNQIEPVEKFIDVIQALYLDVGYEFHKIKKIVVPRMLKRKRNEKDTDSSKIIERLYQYRNEKTFEIVNYYKSLCKLQEVPNTGSPEALQMFVDRYVPSLLSKNIFE